MREAVLFAIAAAASVAQSPGPLAEIQGHVVDSQTSLPITGVRVILMRIDRGAFTISPEIWKTAPSAEEPDPSADRLAMITGSDGAFRFRVAGPLRCYLFMDRDGYVSDRSAGSSQTTYEVKAGESRKDVVIRLQPESGTSGRVIDAGTEQPARGLHVWAYKYRMSDGGRTLLPGGDPATVNEEGRFKLLGLSPGDYFLEVRPPLGAKIGAAKPVEDFRHDVRFAYGPTWYPGVERREEASPVTLLGGRNLEGIDLKIEKRKIAAVRGRVTWDEDANLGDEAIVELTKVDRPMGAQSFMIVARGRVKNNIEFECDELSPGTYHLTAETPDTARAPRQIAVLNFNVERENLEGLNLHLARGLTIAGRVRIAGREEKPDEPALPGEQVQIRLDPRVRAPFREEMKAAPVRAKDGTFTLENVIPDRYRVMTVTAPRGFQISEVRYNGASCPFEILSIDPGALAHRLEITLAPASGAVSAAVTEGSRAAPGATVVLARDPVTGDTPDHALQWKKSDQEGKAVIGELLPGVYRIIAYSDGELWKSDANLKRRLADGQELKVGANSVESVSLRAQTLH